MTVPCSVFSSGIAVPGHIHCIHLIMRITAETSVHILFQHKKNTAAPCFPEYVYCLTSPTMSSTLSVILRKPLLPTVRRSSAI